MERSARVGTNSQVLLTDGSLLRKRGEVSFIVVISRGPGWQIGLNAIYGASNGLLKMKLLRSN